MTGAFAASDSAMSVCFARFAAGPSPASTVVLASGSAATAAADASPSAVVIGVPLFCTSVVLASAGSALTAADTCAIVSDCSSSLTAPCVPCSVDRIYAGPSKHKPFSLSDPLFALDYASYNIDHCDFDHCSEMGRSLTLCSIASARSVAAMAAATAAVSADSDSAASAVARAAGASAMLVLLSKGSAVS